MKYAQNVLDLIGNTPLVRINSVSNQTGGNILGKAEFINPSHSVKDRIAKSMIERGLKDGLINKDTAIIEPTSGNTGIGLAMVCASLGLKLILTMPSSMSLERRKLLKAFGAQLVLTEPELGMKGAVNKAIELAKDVKNSFVPQQFNNIANPLIHKATTAIEIWDATNGKIDAFVAGVGTGGTITGVGEVLKEKKPDVKVFAVEPDISAVLSGEKPGPHKIQGIGAGFVPQVLDTKIYDEILKISYEDSCKMALHIAKNDGLLVGISTGANVYAASLIAKRPEFKGKTIVTVLCDTGERYLSTGLYD